MTPHFSPPDRGKIILPPLRAKLWKLRLRTFLFLLLNLNGSFKICNYLFYLNKCWISVIFCNLLWYSRLLLEHRVEFVEKSAHIGSVFLCLEIQGYPQETTVRNFYCLFPFGFIFLCNYKLISFFAPSICQGVPRNITVGEKYKNFSHILFIYLTLKRIIQNHKADIL